ncbi:hypothetical protein [Hymenobacter sp. UYP22]|uniref:hypothetical protein n=1 Tax=Hymenobacter sp. UYP22 TaxID=3156348 RepID=UPI0033961F67
MRSFLVSALISLGCLASCSRTPYTALPQSPAYHHSGVTTTHTGSPVSASAPASVAPAPAMPAAPAASHSQARPTRPAAGRALTLARGRSLTAAATTATAPLRPVVRKLLPNHRAETAARTQTSSLGSSVLVILGILVATVAGAFLVVGAAFGASAGPLIVAALLFVGGIFVAVRGLRRK